MAVPLQKKFLIVWVPGHTESNEELGLAIVMILLLFSLLLLFSTFCCYCCSFVITFPIRVLQGPYQAFRY